MKFSTSRTARFRHDLALLRVRRFGDIGNGGRHTLDQPCPIGNVVGVHDGQPLAARLGAQANRGVGQRSLPIDAHEHAAIRIANSARNTTLQLLPTIPSAIMPQRFSDERIGKLIEHRFEHLAPLPSRIQLGNRLLPV
jgi:hypothetical protein